MGGSYSRVIRNHLTYSWRWSHHQNQRVCWPSPSPTPSSPSSNHSSPSSLHLADSPSLPPPLYHLTLFLHLSHSQCPSQVTNIFSPSTFTLSRFHTFTGSQTVANVAIYKSSRRCDKREWGGLRPYWQSHREPPRATDGHREQQPWLRPALHSPDSPTVICLFTFTYFLTYFTYLLGQLYLHVCLLCLLCIPVYLHLQ